MQIQTQAIPQPPLDLPELKVYDEGLASSTLPARLKKNSLYKTVLNYVEKPWAPVENDLPERSSLKQIGHSDQPFRTDALNTNEVLYRKQRMSLLKKSERKERISSWSSVYSYDVPMQNLPANFENFKILHLSDIHFEYNNSRPINEIENLARWLNNKQINPDMIVLTGDFINNHPRDFSDKAKDALYQVLDTSCNSYFVLGNHDFHGYKESLISEMLSDIGARNLTNAHSRLIVGDHSINLYGVDDAIFGKPETPNVARPKEINLMLTHNLDALRSNFPDKFDLILSGHTHWGEIRFLNGTKFMNMWGYADLVNRQNKHWDCLTSRALSYISPGLARHYIRIPGIRYAPGFAIHNLKNEDNL